MATFANRSKALVSIVVNVDPIDIHTGSHDIADAAIADIENPLHHLLLRLLQQPAFLTRSDQKFQLFRGVQEFLDGSRTETAEPQQQVSQTVQAHDRRPEHEPEYAEGTDYSEGSAFASLERQALWCELTQDDMKCGYDDKGDRDGDGVRANRRERPEPPDR